MRMGLEVIVSVACGVELRMAPHFLRRQKVPAVGSAKEGSVAGFRLLEERRLGYTNRACRLKRRTTFIIC